MQEGNLVDATKTEGFALIVKETYIKPRSSVDSFSLEQRKNSVAVIGSTRARQRQRFDRGFLFRVDSKASFENLASLSRLSLYRLQLPPFRILQLFSSTHTHKRRRRREKRALRATITASAYHARSTRRQSHFSSRYQKDLTVSNWN